MRKAAATIYQAALRAVEPAAALKNALSRDGHMLHAGSFDFDLRKYTQIMAVGAGKASAPMATALEEILGPLEGVVVVKDGHLSPTRKIELAEAAHPLPDQRGARAGRRIMRMLERADENTLVFNLLSGGGSALLTAPAAGLTLADKQRTTRLLLAAGADIGRVNAVRKHLSCIKGGNLARLAWPATVISLIISDVVGDNLDAIASGPTVGDSSTWEEVEDIFTRFGLWPHLPQAVRRRLRAGLAGDIPETPKEQCFPHVCNIIIASNSVALDAARRQALALGFKSMILSSTIVGDTVQAAAFHAAIAQEIIKSGQPLSPPACVVSGGETTVALPKKHGQGGRNQEFALALLETAEQLPGVLFLSLGTDGSDGPTNAAGALVDCHSAARARQLGLDPRDYLQRHDAYNFFAQTGDLIITGPTNTNVMDLHLILAADSMAARE
jgi:hydroxypyruvate reductase